MKKRILAGAVSLSLLFALTACGDPTGETKPGDDWQLRREKITQEEMDWVPGDDQVVTLDTACGQIQGIQREGYQEFRGVPYATAERWKQAEQVTQWDGVYDATVWGDACTQFLGVYHMADSTVSQFYLDEALASAPLEYSEDCLNLNIWAPDDAEDCPVLVYIHGGSYMTGSNADTSTDGEAYAHHGVITVSINYRLGPFHSVWGDGYTGNLALTDQLTALRWVKANIADYGGDPNRITVMGESAGAMFVAVCLFFFAFSTILSWNLFGKINVIYLFGKKSVPVYSAIALVFIFLGTLMSNDLVWELTDMFNNLMVIPNAIGLFALTGVVVASTHGVGVKK